jgi:hypothetical protein
MEDAVFRINYSRLRGLYESSYVFSYGFRKSDSPQKMLYVYTMVTVGAPEALKNVEAHIRNNRFMLSFIFFVLIS